MVSNMICLLFLSLSQADIVAFTNDLTEAVTLMPTVCLGQGKTECDAALSPPPAGPVKPPTVDDLKILDDPFVHVEYTGNLSVDFMGLHKNNEMLACSACELVAKKIAEMAETLLEDKIVDRLMFSEDSPNITRDDLAKLPEACVFERYGYKDLRYAPLASYPQPINRVLIESGDILDKQLQTTCEYMLRKYNDWIWEKFARRMKLSSISTKKLTKVICKKKEMICGKPRPKKKMQSKYEHYPSQLKMDYKRKFGMEASPDIGEDEMREMIYTTPSGGITPEEKRELIDEVNADMRKMQR